MHFAELEMYCLSDQQLRWLLEGLNPEQPTLMIFIYVDKIINVLLAWDIPNMAYLSIINANDYRKNVMTEEMVGIGVNLYREYENKHSGSEYLKNAGLR